MRYFLVPVLLILFSVSPAVAGPIYVYKLSDGSIRFSSKPPKNGQDAKVFTAKSAKYSVYKGIRRGRGVGKLFTKAYRTQIQQAANEFSLPASLIQAVIHAESAFREKAVSRKGAQGLMQLMPAVARELRVKDPFQPSQNIMGGSKLLSELLDLYEGDKKLALAAYNAGQGAVERYKGIPPFPETQQYVRRVLELERRYSYH